VDQQDRPDRDHPAGGDIAAIPRVRVSATEDVAGALDELGLRRGRPVLVLVGGASGMADPDLDELRTVLREVALPLLNRLDAVVVDGGTDAGVMRVVGQARRDGGGEFPLIGVAAEGTVVLPGADGQNPDAADLEPHHTGFVLVPGHEWGDESPWLGRVADAVADGARSATLLVNGGKIALLDAQASIDRGRRVVVLAGTGRTADAIALARTDPGADLQATAIATDGLTTVVPVADADAIRGALEAALAAG
jgi:SLOG in TRPM, prokaryote